jgi:hypothetical protein
MYNKKAMIVPVLGTVLVVFAIVLASIIGLVIGPTFQGEAIQKGGLGISIHNHAEFWIKALDESIQIISRRSAYDLGKSGGIIGPEVFTWFTGYPTMDTLQKNLESQIKESLPQGTIKAGRTIEWGAGFIDALYLDCGPIASSECFFVKGNKSLSISDKAIEAKISLNPHKFYFKIDSNYFRLLNAGRTILDIDPFKTIVFVDKDLGKLQREINNAKAAGDSRFKDLDVGITVSGDVVEFTILDKTCLLKSDNYCITPLKPGEPGIINPIDGKLIPYDFLKLKFRVNVENPIAPPACTRSNPTVTITPSTQTGPQGSSLTYTVSVKNNDGSDCGSSIFALSNTVCPSELACALNKNSLTISPGLTDSTTITVSSTLLTPVGTHTFKVKATNFGETNYWREDSADYVIPPECIGHSECAQECDDLGIDFKWHGRNCRYSPPICDIYNIWTGTCPEGDAGCMTGQCCIGQCQSNKCVCSHTNFVDVYGNRCPSGQTCGADCYCHPTSICTANLIPTVTGNGPCTVALSMSTSGCDRQIWEIRNATGQVCAGIVSDSVSCPVQTVPLGSHNYNLYINGVLKDSDQVECVAPSCIGDLTTSVWDPGTGTCTIGASFIPYNCDNQGWEIRDTNNNVKCSGTLPDTNCPTQWSFSGTNYTYLYIGGVLKSTRTDTCGAAPVCSAVFSAIISGTGPVMDTCEVSASFIPTNCDNKPWQIKDSSTDAVVCGKTLPDSACQWIVFSGATGTTYIYDLYIDGVSKGTSSVRCNPTPECTIDSDCTGGSRCTEKRCNPLTTKCEYPPKPAGTVFATKSGYCPTYCSANTKYTSTSLKSCDRKCDGVSANEPDCDFSSGCTPSDYSPQSCGTNTRTCSSYCSAGVKYTTTGNQQCNNGCASDGINCDSCTPPPCSYTSQSCGTSSTVCEQKCEGGVEYSNGHVKSCNLACASDGINCDSSCSTPSCGSTDYDTKRTCHNSCNGNRCTWVYFCNYASGSNNEIQCLDCCDWGGCTAPYNCGCSVPKQIITEFQSSPSCYYYWDCCTGWWNGVCTSCGWCPVTVTASCGYNDACTYGKFCSSQTSPVITKTVGCGIGSSTASSSCTIDTQCAYSGSLPTCTYYQTYKCNCVLGFTNGCWWESPTTFTATCT